MTFLVRSICLANLLIVLPATAVAQEPQAPTGPSFTAAEALRALYRENPFLLAREAGVRAAGYDAVDVGLWTNPVVDVAYGYSVAHQMNQGYAADTGYISGGLTQFFEVAGVPGARRDAAERERDAQHTEYLGLRQALELNVREALVHLVAIQARIGILVDAEAGLARAQRIVTARVTAGAAPDYDASRIFIAHESAQADVDDARADLAAARGALEVAVGPGARTLRGDAAVDLLHGELLPPVEQLVQRARTQRPDVVAALRRAESADATRAAAQRSVFPGVGVRLGVGFGQSTGQFDVGIGLTLPLPIANAGQGAIPAATARGEANRDLSHAIAVAAEQRVRAAYGEVVARRAAQEAYEATGVTRSQGLRGEAEAGYDAGHFSVLELADAYQATRDARLRVIQLAEDARIAELELLRAVMSGQ